MLEVQELVAPEVGLIDLFARLRLAAREAGYDLRLRGASPELRELIGLCGLEQVLLCVEACGQPEEGEETRRIEEEAELLDPPP